MQLVQVFLFRAFGAWQEGHSLVLGFVILQIIVKCLLSVHSLQYQIHKYGTLFHSNILVLFRDAKLSR